MSEEIVTPVVTEVATEVVQKQSEPSTDSNQNDEPQGETPEPSEAEKAKAAFEKRIARQTAANRDQQRQLQEAQKRIAELEKVTAKADPLADKPQADDYDDIDAYAEALADWKDSNRQKERAQGEGQKQTEQERIAQAIEFEKKKLSFESKQEAFKAKEPEYDRNADVVNRVMTLANPQDASFQAFASVVLNADDSPALINYLGKNPQDMLALFGKSPFEVEDRLFEIIESLANKPAPQAQIKADLPEPPRGLSGSSKISKEPMKMQKDEFRDWLKTN